MHVNVELTVFIPNVILSQLKSIKILNNWNFWSNLEIKLSINHGLLPTHI